MDFSFSEEQTMFRDSVAAMLAREVTPQAIRARWDSPDGIDHALSRTLVDMGLSAMLVPEAHGGMGLDEVDFVQIAEECGRVALPEPLVDYAMVSTRLIVDLAERDYAFAARAGELLRGIAAGELCVATAHTINPWLNFAAKANWLLLPNGDEVHLLDAARVQCTAQRSVDPSRRPYRLDWQPVASTRIADGRLGARLWSDALNRGALGAAAQLLGLASAMIVRSAEYSAQREQFGRPIGANQAVKHLLADCAVRVEFAKAVVYRAAWVLAVAPERAGRAVSHAKVAAAEGALLCARNGIQVHGAMGYTWECDLQIWAKRAWALEKAWGDSGFHKNRIHEWLLDPRARIGAGFSFEPDAAAASGDTKQHVVSEVA